MMGVVGLSPWQDTTVHEPLLQSGDWLCTVRYHQRQDLERLAAQFPSDAQVFDAIGYNLGRDRLHGAFLRLRALRGIQLPQDAYLAAETAVPSLLTLSRFSASQFEDVNLTDEMAILDLGPLRARSVMNVGCRYSNTVMVRVLSPASVAANEGAPQSADYVSPTWAEYIRLKADQGDVRLLMITEHLERRDYTYLHLAYELMLDALNHDNKRRAAKEMSHRDWAPAAELESFRETAHNHFRHAIPRPQTTPYMPFWAADQLVRRLSAYFIVDCMKLDGLVP